MSTIDTWRKSPSRPTTWTWEELKAAAREVMAERPAGNPPIDGDAHTVAMTLVVRCGSDADRARAIESYGDRRVREFAAELREHLVTLPGGLPYEVALAINELVEEMGK